VHFASRNAYFAAPGRLHPSNRAVMTWFHGSETDPEPENQRMIRLLPAHAARFDAVVTACSTTRKRLVRWGVPDERVKIIPLGVDLAVFRPADPDLRLASRRRLGIPKEAVCIGSFQKDGLGWGEGLQPKLIKGPDILLAVLERLARRRPIFVLLTGPARGYVRRGLERLRIPYHHNYARALQGVADYYQALDLYLITSRDEGGPMSVLEAMASGVVLVSTQVGMACDLIRDGANGRLLDVDDVDGLAEAATVLLDDHELRARCIQEGLRTAWEHDWAQIARRYYEDVYQSLLGETPRPLIPPLSLVPVDARS
jgi:glycosyltransferase involved in cell wall biosynthesis